MNKRTDRSLGSRREELVAILPNIRRFALSLTGNLADADDLMQNTVERLLERGLPQDAGLMPWTIKVCRNLWIDEVRARKVRSAAATELQLTRPGSAGGEQAEVAKLELREIEKSLADLPEEQRVVLELVSVEGYSYRQTAEALDIPIGTVMSRLARARANLARRDGR